MTQMHLNKSGSGITSKTACGRNAIRTPMSTDWEGFKKTAKRCEKCEASRAAEVSRRVDAKKEAEELEKWVPVDDSDEWKRNDAALIAAHKAKKQQTGFDQNQVKTKSAPPRGALNQGITK